MKKIDKETYDLIVKSQLPVIFFDTCILLNILNSLHLEDLPDNYANNAIDLISLHGEKVWLVTCETVKNEWHENIDTVQSKLNVEIKKTDRNIKSIINIANYLQSRTYKMPFDVAVLNLPFHMKSVSEKLLNTCLLVSHTDQQRSKAMERVSKNIAPASRGRSEPKDCLIIESFFDLCDGLRKLNFNKKIVFITANINDFGKYERLKSPLDEEFQNMEAILVNRLNHSLSIVDGAI